MTRFDAGTNLLYAAATKRIVGLLRVPDLIAGAFFLWAAYRMAREAFGGGEVATSRGGGDGAQSAGVVASQWRADMAWRRRSCCCRFRSAGWGRSISGARREIRGGMPAFGASSRICGSGRIRWLFLTFSFYRDEDRLR